MYTLVDFICLSAIVFLALLTLVSNILTCFIFFNNKNRKLRPKLLLGNIAVSDILYIIGFIIPFLIVTPIKITSDIWIIQLIESLMILIMITTEYSQSITMTIISYDRYYKIVRVLHKNPCDKFSGKVWLIIIWILSLVLALPFLPTFDIFTFNYTTLTMEYIHLNYWLINGTLTNYDNCNNFNYYTFTSRFLLAYLIPLVISSINYARICRELWKSKTSENSINTEKEKISIKMLIVTVVAFAVLRIGFYIIVLCGLLKKNQSCFVAKVEQTSYMFDVLYVISATVNPFIYWWFSRSFRDNFVEIFKHKIPFKQFVQVFKFMYK
jgi:hypothetical protein